MVRRRRIPTGIVAVVAAVAASSATAAVPATAQKRESATVEVGLSSWRDAGAAIGTQFHCVWEYYNDTDRIAVLDKLKGAGVQWVRIDAGWGSMEDVSKGFRNAWHVRRLDFCVNQARKRGMEVLVTLWRTPPWANGGQAPQVPPLNVHDYADFARWAAARWRGRVAAWEVWNEPDPSQTFWRGSVAHYAELLKAAYPAFKSGDPDALVVVGGPASNDFAWIRGLYSLGVKDAFDVMATHPYQGIGDRPPEAAGDGARWWFSSLPAVRSVMIEFGDAEKSIWFTEFGWSAHRNWPGVENWQRGVTPQQQAEYLTRAIRYSEANYPYVPAMFWYKERARGGSDVHQDGYALLNRDLSPRPVYDALKNYLTGP